MLLLGAACCSRQQRIKRRVKATYHLRFRCEDESVTVSTLTNALVSARGKCQKTKQQDKKDKDNDKGLTTSFLTTGACRRNNVVEFGTVTVLCR